MPVTRSSSRISRSSTRPPRLPIRRSNFASSAWSSRTGGTPQSAIISAIVFNALVIPLLVPIALRGVKYKAAGATALLRRNLLIYGLGGLIAPFVGIKLIDLIVHNLLGA